MKNANFTARTTENIPQTKRIFKTVESFLTEAIIQIDKDGLNLVASDPAMVALINLELEPEYFSEEYSVDEPVKPGANVHSFYEAIRKANKGEELKVEYGTRDNNQTTWGMESAVVSDVEESNGFEVQVSTDDGFWTKKGLPTLNLNEDDVPNVGDLQWENEVKITGKKMKRALNLFKSDADAIKLSSHENGFYIEAKTGREETFESGFEDENVEFKGEPVEASTEISLDYASKLFGQRLEHMADKVTVFQAQSSEDEGSSFGGNDANGDYPVKFKVEGEDFKLEVIIAPRIDDE